MNTILDLVEQRKGLIALIAGGVLGLLLGLAIGWWWWPVEWTNSTPGNLRQDFQNDYIVWVAEQYERTGDLGWASSRLGVEYWKEDQLATTLGELAAALGGDDAERLDTLAADLGAMPAAVEPAPVDAESETSPLRSVALVCGAALLVVAFVGGAAYLVNRVRQQKAAAEVPGRGVAGEMRPAEAVSWGEDGPPLFQHVTAYALGDDHYDPSFSIELESGEFMGECGVGVSEVIGVGTPNKVTAFEIWLFDKSDIRTVTKVLMSDYSFHDEALRTKLAPKGEPVLAEVGKDLILETKTLRMRARIVEAEYGMGNLPSNSFFGRLAIDMAVWVLPEREGAPLVAGEGAPLMPPTL